MVRRKNVLATIRQSFIALCIISVQWVLFGYSLAFGPDIGHFIGSLKWIGLSGVGVVCYFAIGLKTKFGYNDSLDVVGVHGVWGTFGALATGLFASAAINPSGSNGLFHGNFSLLGIQALSVIAAIVYSFVISWILLKVFGFNNWCKG